MSLLGSIKSQSAILLAERAAFSTSDTHLSSFAQSLQRIENLGANDIYSWFLASSTSSSQSVQTKEEEERPPPDLKLNLIFPCTQKHVAKYSAQGVRMVTETPEIYQKYILPHMRRNREAGRLNWVFNILDGKTEQEDVILRQHQGGDRDEEGFLLLPDLNWDRKTIPSLHLLAIVTRRDIWSVRDLKKKHVPWLRKTRQKILEATTGLYPGLEADQLKLYLHYQPTYYHFHVHVVHVMLESGSTQAVGKALGLEDVIGRLTGMAREEGTGMDSVSLTYGLGEANDLWMEVFQPLKAGKEPDKGLD